MWKNIIIGISILIILTVGYFNIELIISNRQFVQSYDKLKAENEQLKKELNSSIVRDLELYEPVLHKRENYSYEKSYWFVFYTDKKRTAEYNGFIELDSHGFSMSEFKEQVGNDKFLINFISISKETWDKNNN